MIACVEDEDHQTIRTKVSSIDLTNKTELTFMQLFNLHNNPIGKDTVVVGYVVSDGSQGNFFKELYVQNTTGTNDINVDDPRMGMRVRINLANPNLKYGFGRRVVINLSGLKKSSANGVLTIGAANGTFLKDIAPFDLDKIILKDDEIGELSPRLSLIQNLTSNDLSTYLKIKDIHVADVDLGKPFAGLVNDDFDGARVLEYCTTERKDSLVLETSNFSDFSDEFLPNDQFDIAGVYHLNFDKRPVFTLNKIEDITETTPYRICEKIMIPNILITEIADPENATFSRFVELYNDENSDLVLDGWSLIRYNNGNSKQIVALDGLVIKAKQFLIIANDEMSTDRNKNFKDSFGFDANLLDTAIDGNGNDAYELRTIGNKRVDVYGDVLSNGLGENWEYTDGKAYRNKEITKPNVVFDIREWTVTKNNQNAPENFTPNHRNDEVEPIDMMTELTADLLLTEVADPKESTKARFVEIYNPTKSIVNLKGWTLVRYNYTRTKNTKELAANVITLEDIDIPVNGFIVIGRDSTVFQEYFEAAASFSATKLDGNGDDAYELIDPFGKVIDVFGDVNKDGSGDAWEYTDGYAQRNMEVNNPNSNFKLSEWKIIKSETTVNRYTPFKR